MNCFRNLIAGVCAVIAATASATAAADEIEKFVATPVRVNDRFDKDTLKQYLTQGDVRWSMLKVSIPTGGMLAFQQLIEARFTLKLDVWPIEFDAQQQCVSQCRFMCGNGWEIVVVLQRVRQVGGIARQVAIAEIQRSGQESEPTVEQLAVSPVFGVPGDVENWTLGYNNGLVEVRCNGQLVVQGCGEAFSSWCNAVAFVQVSGKTELTQFSLQGRKAGYSPDQRRLYEETQRLRAQAEQALAEGDVKRAIQTEQQRFPLYERAFGKDELPAALSHQWIAEVADQLQRYAPAKRYFQQSADVFAKNLGDHHPQTLRARGWVGYEDAMLGNLDEGEAVLRPATEEYARICGLQDRGTRQLAYKT